MNKEELGIRFKYLRLKNRLTQREFGDLLYISQSKVRDIERGHIGLSTNLIIDLKNKLKFEAVFILFSEDISYIRNFIENRKSIPPNSITKIPFCELLPNSKKNELITVFDISIDNFFLEGVLDSEHLNLIRIHGNGMSPSINSHDLVLIKPMEEFDGEGIYVLKSNGKLIARRLQKNIDKNIILVLCDSSFYSTEEISKENMNMLLIAGKIIANMKFFNVY